MAALVVAYCRSPSIGGFLIRNADRWGRWSHCGLLTPEATVIEARAFHGVVETPRSEFVRRYVRGAMEFVAVDVVDPAAAYAWAREQVGKGYDYGAILGNVLRESWQDDSRWECSELVEMAIAKAGRERFRDAPWRISPNLSFMVR